MNKKYDEDQAHPSLAMSLNNVGTAYHTLGETQKGLAYLVGFYSFYLIVRLRSFLWEIQDNQTLSR